MSALVSRALTDTSRQLVEDSMYDAMLGRFLERDPIGFAAGDANFYLYVHDSPTDLTDAYGLVCCCAKFPESCKIVYELDGFKYVGKIIRDPPKEALANWVSQIMVTITVVSTKGTTCGCHIAQAALSTKIYNKPIPNWNNPPAGFPRNKFPVAFPIFTNSSETYVNFQDYNGSETKCDKKDNAYITDSPGTSGTQGLVNDPLVTYYLFAAVNWVVEAPSVVGAYYNQTSWDWSNGVTVKLNRGSSDKALNKTDGFKNK